MRLLNINITRAEASVLENAIRIVENIANRAESNADNTDNTEIADMNLEIRDTADRASTAIDYLFETVKNYDRAGYNDTAE